MGLRAATAALLVCFSSTTLAQPNRPRLERGDSRLWSLNRIVAEPVAGVYANSVEADLVVSIDGRVESVTITKGNQAHRASATPACDV